MTYNEALKLFVARIKEASDMHYAEKYPNLTPCDFEIQSGRNYDRIVRVTRTRYNDARSESRSVHSFVIRVATKTKALGQTRVGDIHKAASWDAPAKHARGSIFSPEASGYGCSVYGANYMTYNHGVPAVK